MGREWLTTGEAASELGVSRQHVVDLCDRGDLSCSRPGTHRRIRRADLRPLGGRGRPGTYEQCKSLWLHRALLGQLMRDPSAVIDQAHRNIDAWSARHRQDGMAAAYLRQWQEVLDSGIESIVDVLTGMDETSIELRQNSPFAGVLPQEERLQVLRSFRLHWNRKQDAA